MKIKVDGESHDLYYNIENNISNSIKSGIGRNLMLNVKYW